LRGEIALWHGSREQDEVGMLHFCHVYIMSIQDLTDLGIWHNLF